MEGGGDGWSSKALITVTSNHRPDSKCFHLARAETPGSHLGSTGIRIGPVFNECVKMEKKKKETVRSVSSHRVPQGVVQGSSLGKNGSF